MKMRGHIWPYTPIFFKYFRPFIFRLMSDNFRQFLGNSRWPYHGLSRRFLTMPKILVYSFLWLVTVCHSLSRNRQAIWSQYEPFSYFNCHISTMHALFAIWNDFIHECISDLTLFMRMDPQGIIWRCSEIWCSRVVSEFSMGTRDPKNSSRSPPGLRRDSSPSSTALPMRLGFVTSKSSPTICT